MAHLRKDDTQIREAFQILLTSLFDVLCFRSFLLCSVFYVIFVVCLCCANKYNIVSSQS